MTDRSHFDMRSQRDLDCAKTDQDHKVLHQQD